MIAVSDDVADGIENGDLEVDDAEVVYCVRLTSCECVQLTSGEDAA